MSELSYIRSSRLKLSCTQFLAYRNNPGQFCQEGIVAVALAGMLGQRLSRLKIPSHRHFLLRNYL